MAALVVVGMAVSAWHPHDRTTWFLETVWVFVGLPAIVLTWRRFPLTGLLCCLLAVHALVLAVGGHYTYAEVPAGDWVRDTFGLSRNPYDRLGHLMQGFVPAVLVREVLIGPRPCAAAAGWRRSRCARVSPSAPCSSCSSGRRP